MAGNDRNDGAIWIIVAIVVILGIWWWRSDNAHQKYESRLEDQIAEYEEKIEELEKENESLREELGW